VRLLQHLQPLDDVLSAEFKNDQVELTVGEGTPLTPLVMTELRRLFRIAIAQALARQQASAAKHLLIRKLTRISRLRPHLRVEACVKISQYADVYPPPDRKMSGFIYHGARVVMLANDGVMALVEYCPVGQVFHPTRRGSRILMRLDTFQDWLRAHQDHTALHGAPDCRPSIAAVA
jgi:hypothetical protein